MSLKKVLTSAGVVATALSLVFAGMTPASAAKVPSTKAKAGAECARAGLVAKAIKQVAIETRSFNSDCKGNARVSSSRCSSNIEV